MSDTKEKHATHTRGPWHYTLADETSSGGVYGGEKCVCDIIPKELQVAYECEEVEIANANARLIAAAPEMYDVLSELFDTLGLSRGYGFDEEYDKLREVLAKVDGGEG